MRDQPTGDDLLRCARKALRDEVLPSLPAEQRHTLLMVMNAMSIAERQLRYGQGPADEELAAMARLLGTKCDEMATGNRRLCDLIRQGGGDPGQPQRAALLAHLRAVGRQRLLESNPKLLNEGNAS
ncbi:MAG TPA: DUF6285 domain-containing protein [Burkholderiaceae bacterium]|jgi:hypothetical protein|nr:DUF6285 domain-containing protein [Burkholderiaceae bacterium]